MKYILRPFSKILSESTNPLISSELAESLSEYSRAMDLIINKNWGMAELELYRCSEIIEKAGHFGDPSHNFVLQRIALVQRAQSKFPQCEKTLEQIVSNYKLNEAKHKNLLELSYLTLFKQYLSSNITKALRLADFLLQPENWKTLSRPAQKDVKFFFGTALILHGKYFNQAKKELYECIRMNPGGNACFVFHNLGCAQWLHMRKFADVEVKDLNAEAEEEFKLATTEFTEAVPNFQKAIQLFEGLPEIYVLESDAGLKNKLTGLSLTNVADVMLERMEAAVINMQKGVEWLKKALKFYEENDKENIGRALTLIATVLSSNKNYLHAEGILRNAVDILKSKKDYNEVHALQVYGKLLSRNEKRKKEAEECFQKAKEIAESLPLWYERSIYLHIPTWTI